MVHSLPSLLCLDDEVITNKERGVAKGVIKLSSSNSGEHSSSYYIHIYSSLTHSRKLVLLAILWICRFNEFSLVGNEACFY